MTEKKKKKSLFWLLFGLPFSMVVTLFIVYIAIYGLQLPFELKMKVQTPDGKFVSASEIQAESSNPTDSSRWRYEKVTETQDSTFQWQFEIDRCRDTLLTLQQNKENSITELVRLQDQLKVLNQQKDAIQQGRMARLTKIFKTLNQDQLDSLYVANLDDNTLMAIIALAKEQQAAAVIRRIEPKRAARLTSQYLNQDLQ